MKSLSYTGLAMLVFAATLVLSPAAQAWQNGRAARGHGGTTVQQWILEQAVSEAAHSGSDWVDLNAALQTVGLPDTVVHDFRYHEYVPSRGGHKGAAPERTAVYFALVRDALRAGDTATASRLLGMLTHYYTDASDPLHTGDCAVERYVHRRFELQVMAQLNARGGFERRVHAVIERSDTHGLLSAVAEIRAASAGRDVAAFTASSAARAHHSYRELVRVYLQRGFSRVAGCIAATTLERSVQGVASLIEAAALPALSSSTPSSGSAAPLSTGCEATASSQNVLYHAARYANDGDHRSAWIAAVGGYPQWWQVDLGTARDLGSVAIDWFKGGSRSYTYDIQVSGDGTTWRQVIDQLGRRAFGGSSDSLAGVRARYVRVDILGCGVRGKTVGDAADSSSAAIVECLVFAASTPDPDRRPAPTPTTDPTPTPSPTPSTMPTTTPTLTPTPTPTNGTVTVPTGATQAQIDACVAKAVAMGAGTWVVFPAGKFAYSGTCIVPDGINVRGQGIWNQGLADGGGGTWLQCAKGLLWGSDSTIEYLLVGKNTAGLTCTFHPVARGSSAAGQSTYAHGSRDCTFRYVRFKGGSDSGASLIDLGGNFGSGLWSGTVKKCDMIDTNWYDCEFERPQNTNAYYTANGGGSIMNIWLDCRVGGAQVYGNGWYRCHFGVKNGYHSGIDGYGIGSTVIFQPAPAEHATDGPRPESGSNMVGDGLNGWNPNFDWSQVDHGFADNRFQDCLFEYALWYPMDVCDYARSYSVWQGNHTGLPGTLTTALSAEANKATGWGNGPQANWTQIPNKMWNVACSMTRCYSKGSYPAPHGLVGEIGKDCIFTDCTCGTGRAFSYGGQYGNVVSGSFTDSNRQVTAIFPAGPAYGWTGTTTSDTPSPYDP